MSSEDWGYSHVSPPPTWWPDLTSARRWGNGTLRFPEFWALTVSQFLAFVAACRATSHWDKIKRANEKLGRGAHVTAYDLNKHFVIPWTHSTGAGVALHFNNEQPLKADLMLSHAWAEDMEECVEALLSGCKAQGIGHGTPIWFCLFANYQPGPTVTTGDLEFVVGTGNLSSSGALQGELSGSISLNVSDGADGSYTQPWQVKELVTLQGSGRGATVGLTVAGNSVTGATVAAGGAGYREGDRLMVARWDVPGLRNGPTVKEQVEMDPFGCVLRSAPAHGMLVIHTGQTEVYTRLWCVYEIATALDMDLRVKAACSVEYTVKNLAQIDPEHRAGAIDYDQDCFEFHLQVMAMTARLQEQSRQALQASSLVTVNTREATCSVASDKELICSTVEQVKFSVDPTKIQLLQQVEAFGDILGAMAQGSLRGTVQGMEKSSTPSQLGRGPQYHANKSTDDRIPDAFASWGSTVTGVDEGDGWLKVAEGHFLPMEVLTARTPESAWAELDAAITEFRRAMGEEQQKLLLDYRTHCLIRCGGCIPRCILGLVRMVVLLILYGAFLLSLLLSAALCCCCCLPCCCLLFALENREGKRRVNRCTGALPLCLYRAEVGLDRYFADLQRRAVVARLQRQRERLRAEADAVAARALRALLTGSGGGSDEVLVSGRALELAARGLAARQAAHRAGAAQEAATEQAIGSAAGAAAASITVGSHRSQSRRPWHRCRAWWSCRETH